MELPVAVHTRSSWRLPFPSVPDTRTSRGTHAHTRAHIPTRDVVQHRQHRHRRQSPAELSFCGPLYTLTSDLLLHSFPSWNIVEREKNGGGEKEVEQSIEHFKTRRHAEFQFRFLPGVDDRFRRTGCRGKSRRWDGRLDTSPVLSASSSWQACTFQTRGTSPSKSCGTRPPKVRCKFSYPR